MFVSTHGFHDWHWHVQRFGSDFISLSRRRSWFFLSRGEIERRWGEFPDHAFSMIFWSESELWIFSPKPWKELTVKSILSIQSFQSNALHRICNSRWARAVLDIKSPSEILTRYQHTTGPWLVLLPVNRLEEKGTQGHSMWCAPKLNNSYSKCLSRFRPCRLSQTIFQGDLVRSASLWQTSAHAVTFKFIP